MLLAGLLGILHEGVGCMLELHARSASDMLSRRRLFHADVERLLLPEHVRLLLRPIEITRRGDVEVPHHASDDQSHLCPGDVLPKTVARTYVKGLENGFSVPGKRG